MEGHPFLFQVGLEGQGRFSNINIPDLNQNEALGWTKVGPLKRVKIKIKNPDAFQAGPSPGTGTSQL